MRRRLAAFILFCLMWWFWLADYVSRPSSYWPVTVWLAVALFAGYWHLRALQRFQRIVKAVRRDEELGLADAGSTLFAVNQRFRYVVRVIENTVAIVIGVAGVYSVHHPKVALHPWYQRLVITFFLGSIAATGYLTIRDLRVVNAVQKQAQQDDIALGPPSPPRWLLEKLRERADE